MKAIVQDEYGSPDVLQLRDIDTPGVEDGNVLVRVRAASVNPADWHLMRGEPRIARVDFGVREPKDKVLGCDVAGVVEAVGEGVTTVAPGAEVFGSPFGNGQGAFAESCLFASEDLLDLKPGNLGFEEAAALPVGSLTALQGLRDAGQVEPGQKVLIVGASGGVGTFAVQIAKSLGAEVTGVCSPRNVEMVRSLGADQVIDYIREDFADGGQRYDMIFQLAGTKSPSECRRALTDQGTLVMSSGEGDGRWIAPLGRVVAGRLLSLFVGQRLTTFTVKPNKEDLGYVKGLVEAGEVTPVIDKAFELDEVPDAIRDLEEGHARGKVVVTV